MKEKVVHPSWEDKARLENIKTCTFWLCDMFSLAVQVSRLWLQIASQLNNLNLALRSFNFAIGNEFMANTSLTEKNLKRS